MYIQVKLLNGFKRSLTYKVPLDWDPTALVGTLITVPLQKRTELALVTDIVPQLPPGSTFKIRTALAQEKIPGDAQYAAFIAKLSAYYLLEPLVFYRRLQTFLEQQALDETQNLSTFQKTVERPKESVILTDEQQAALAVIQPLLQNPVYAPVLIQGVTGSGKTEVYKQALELAYRQGKSVLFLVPEVSLAVRFTHIFKAVFPDIPFFGFHSATSVKDKKMLWNALMHQHPVVIVGVHLPLLLPLPNLGLIIIDEEHDPGFQEKKHPKINTKEAALLRAQLLHIPVLLGSATPSLQALHHVAAKKWRCVQLKKRFSGAFPTLQTVKLATGDKRAHFWVSRELEKALVDRLAKKEQAIIFMNRRGYSFFVQCAACGFVFECPHCSVSLTLHEDGSLRCHYCNHTQQQPDRCGVCKPQKPTLLKKGIGTQQVVSILQQLFPQARIERADLDSTVNKKKWQATITQFYNKEIDILVGTQTITKGYHFPGVTLVGVIWADINLHMPFYSAAETTLQQLIQVAGRAGRQSPESLVIVQTMLEHTILQHLNEENYQQFYDEEIVHRAELQYPPCVRLAEIELRHTDEKILERESKLCAETLSNFNRQHSVGLTILGPAQPPVHKVKNVFSRKIYLKNQKYGVIHAAVQELKGLRLESQLFFTPNPLQ